MTDQAAIDAALDSMEFPDDPIEHVVDEIPEIKPEAEVIEEDPEPNPPGFIDNIDDWVAAGKDPDLFKGKKAYEAEYERIQEIKDLKVSQDELKALMKTVVDASSDWKTQQQAQMNVQIEQARIDATAELERAKEDTDIDAALAAQDKINNLNKPAAQPAPAQAQPRSEISDFVKSNPILDPNSTLYDSSVAATLAKAQNSAMDRLTGGDRDMPVTPEELKGSLAKAMSVVKELYPDKFKSPRNNRRGNSNQPPKRGAPANTGDYGTRLKAMKSTSLNSRDTNPDYDLYEMIKAKDPKGAEAFAKTMLGDS